MLVRSEKNQCGTLQKEGNIAINYMLLSAPTSFRVCAAPKSLSKYTTQILLVLFPCYLKRFFQVSVKTDLLNVPADKTQMAKPDQGEFLVKKVMSLE